MGGENFAITRLFITLLRPAVFPCHWFWIVVAGLCYEQSVRCHLIFECRMLLVTIYWTSILGVSFQ